MINNRGASVDVQNVTKSFSGRIALDNVTFSLASSSCALIGGANGSGKSVLMSIIAGLEKPSSGTVKITAADGEKESAGLVFQEADEQILGETPFEDVMYGLLNKGMAKPDATKIAKDALSAVGLLEKASSPARFLSGGEKRRLAVSCILAMDRPLVIFDEPYANLDYDGVKQVNALVSMLKEKRRTIIILTHELEKSLALCNRLIILCAGLKVFDGNPKEGLKQPLEKWGIRNPIVSYRCIEDLVWL